jgi:CBS domain-containing protein
VIPDTAPTVPIEIVLELMKLNPSRPTPATDPDTLLVGSVNVTDPFGALAANAATDIAAGVPLLRA